MRLVWGSRHTRRPRRSFIASDGRMGGKRRKRKGKVGREGGDPESVSRGEVCWVERELFTSWQPWHRRPRRRDLESKSNSYQSTGHTEGLLFKTRPPRTLHSPGGKLCLNFSAFSPSSRTKVYKYLEHLILNLVTTLP